MDKKWIILICIVVTIVVIGGIVYAVYELIPRENVLYDETSYRVEEKENEVIEAIYYTGSDNLLRREYVYKFENDKLTEITEYTHYKNISKAKLAIRDKSFNCLDLSIDKNVIKNKSVAFESDLNISKSIKVEQIHKNNKEEKYKSVK